MTSYIKSAVVIILLLALGLQAILSMRLKSVTYDELSYLPAGYSFLQTHDFRLNIEHPPLIKTLAAIPLLFLDLKLPLEHAGWEKADKWEFGRQFLFYANSNTDQIIFWGRMPIVILSLLLAIFVFCWARELNGFAGGFLALYLYVFCPNIIAHSQLVTTDLGVGCFMVIAIYSLGKYLKVPSPQRLIITGLTLGLALVSKFLALILLPLYPLLIFFRNDKRSTVISTPFASLRVNSGRNLGGIIRFLASLGMTNGFAMKKAEGAGSYHDTLICKIRQTAVLTSVIFGLALIVIYLSYGSFSAPFLYLKGISITYADHDPQYEYFLWGSYSHTGWWYYYLVTLVLKSTIPALVLIGISGVLWLKEYRNKALYFLVLPIMALLVVTMFDSANIGLRRILPVYPFLFIFASRAALIARRKPWGLMALSLLCLWHFSSAIRIYPDYLAYFNELAGGVDKGIYYLDDSNIDWGQDLKQLKEYIEQNGIRPIKIHCFSSVQPEDYGINYEKITPQELISPRKGYYYAISVHILQRKSLYRNPKSGQTLRYDWLQKYQPLHQIGHSIYIYKF